MFLQRSKAKFREMKGKERDATSKKENTNLYVCVCEADK